MTIKARILSVLQEGPATSSEIALEVYGDDSNRSIHRTNGHLFLLRERLGVKMRAIGLVPSTKGKGGPQKLWELAA